MQGQERVHHVNFLQPHQRGVQHFSLPEYSENSGKCISITLSTHVETCVLLSRKKSSGKSTKIEIEIDLNEADRRECIGTATYQEIKDYVWEHYQTKVSHLYIAQIKKKCGLDVGENFNKPKTEGNKVPNCPPEKERMIKEALEYFGMINKE